MGATSKTLMQENDELVKNKRKKVSKPPKKTKRRRVAPSERRYGGREGYEDLF